MQKLDNDEYKFLQNNKKNNGNNLMNNEAKINKK